MTGMRLSAQTPEASDSGYLYREVEKLYEKGRYDEAITRGERLLGLREKEVGQQNPEIAKILLRLASLYRATSVSDKAEPYYRRAIAIGEKSFGPNHRSVGAALERYSCLLRRKARDV